MEILFAYSYLWVLDFSDGQEYCKHLNYLFMNETDNDLLLELECCTDAEVSLMRIERYFEYEAKNFDVVLFGKTLFSEIDKIYHRQILDIDLFVEKCSELYTLLPSCIDMYEEPFNVLGYIDDMLKFNSLNETKERIEKMLSFYK